MLGRTCCCLVDHAKFSLNGLKVLILDILPQLSDLFFFRKAQLDADPTKPTSSHEKSKSCAFKGRLVRWRTERGEWNLTGTKAAMQASAESARTVNHLA